MFGCPFFSNYKSSMGQDYVRLKDGYKKGPQKVICDNYCKHVLKQTL